MERVCSKMAPTQLKKKKSYSKTDEAKTFYFTLAWISMDRVPKTKLAN